MHIRFLVANAYRVGGTVRTVFNLAGALAANHQVEIASMKSGTRPALEPPDGVRIRSLDANPGIAGYVRTAQAGVLIGTRPELNVALARLARPGVLALAQEHFHLEHHRPDQQADIQRWYPLLDAHVSLTARDAQTYRQLLGPHAVVRHIPNGIPDPGVSPSTSMAPVVVAAGRLNTQKGYDLLLRAWQQVRDVHPDWRLRIFGAGRQRPRLEAMIGQLDLARHVELAGFTDRLPSELA